MFTYPALLVCVHDVGLNVTVLLSWSLTKFSDMLPTIGIASRQPGPSNLNAGFSGIFSPPWLSLPRKKG